MLKCRCLMHLDHCRNTAWHLRCTTKKRLDFSVLCVIAVYKLQPFFCRAIEDVILKKQSNSKFMFAMLTLQFFSESIWTFLFGSAHNTNTTQFCSSWVQTMGCLSNNEQYVFYSFLDLCILHSFSANNKPFTLSPFPMDPTA